MFSPLDLHLRLLGLSYLLSSVLDLPGLPQQSPAGGHLTGSSSELEYWLRRALKGDKTAFSITGKLIIKKVTIPF